MTKPSIIVSGNCQTGVLAHALRRTPWVSSQYDVFHEPFDYKPDEPIVVSEDDWRRCAILWCQLGISQTADRGPDFAGRVKTITFPPLDFPVLWPFTVKDPLFPPEQHYPTSMYPEADGLVGEISEIEPEELHGAPTGPDGEPDWLKMFDELSQRSVRTLERNVEAETQRLVARDLHVNVQMAGYIISHFRTERLFHTRNHANDVLMTVLLNRLLAATWPGKTGERQPLFGAAEAAFQYWDPCSHYQVPVNRRVAEKLKLEWWREDLLHRTDASVRTELKQTGDEYFAGYITERRRRWLAGRKQPDATPTPIRKGSSMERIIQSEDGKLSLVVPLDHAAVLQCRPADYIYTLVEKRIANDDGAIDAWLEACRPYIDAAEFAQIGFEKGEDRLPYWNNGYFSGEDARCLVAMLRYFNPRRYVEIGSGNSTKFARWGIDNWGLQTKITCIDPVPRAVIEHVADKFVQKSLLEVDDEIFETLESGDILFHDGSHLVFNGTDTTKLFLEVLPLIKPGVIVHIHDISLPWENASAFDNRGYNEQYLLAAMLLFSTGWEVLAPIAYMQRTGRLKDGGMSFWMRKR